MKVDHLAAEVKRALRRLAADIQDPGIDIPGLAERSKAAERLGLNLDAVRRYQESLGIETPDERPEAVPDAAPTRDQPATKAAPAETPKDGERDRPIPKTRTKVKYPEDFTQFWALYPRKDGKQDALGVWKGLSLPDRAAAVADVKTRLQRDEQWQRDGGRFIKYAQGYLSGRRWEDQTQGETRAAIAEARAANVFPCTQCGSLSETAELLAHHRWLNHDGPDPREAP